MNSKRTYYLLIALLFVLSVLGVGAVYKGVQILNSKTTTLNDLKAEISATQDLQSSLANAKKDVIKYADTEKVVKTIIPQEKDQARTVREIIKIASDSNVKIASISFPSSNLGSKPTAGQAASGENTQTQKVEGITNVERLEITVGSDTGRPVLYSNFIAFLNGLEQNRRTAQVSSINILPDSTNRNQLTFSMTLNVYIKK